MGSRTSARDRGEGHRLPCIADVSTATWLGDGFITQLPAES